MCVCASECGTVCFCVWRYCVCESRPLTAAELSLIQLCLLSCLLAALAWGSGLALPQLCPPCLHPASWPGPWAYLWLSESPLGVCFLSPCPRVTTSSFMSLLVSFRPCFFLSLLFSQQTSSHGLPPTLPHLSQCAGAGDLKMGQTQALSLRPSGETDGDGDSPPRELWWGPQGRQHGGGGGCLGRALGAWQKPGCKLSSSPRIPQCQGLPEAGVQTE